MALPRNLNLRLFLVLGIMTWHLLDAGSPTEILNATVGGNVTFHCPLENRTLRFFYLQKNDVFVNGYYRNRRFPNIWNNTWVDNNTKAVHMYNVNVSHAGVYECLMEYEGSLNPHKAIIHLNVAANCSKPEITVLSSDQNYWRLKCFSHGGYPRPKIRWNVPEIQMIKVENTSDTKDPVTETFNSSSIIRFNCSVGGIQSISCFAGEIESVEISVCSQKDPPGPSINLYDIAAICAVLAVLIIAIIGAVLLKRRITRSDTTPEHAMTNGDTVNNEQETPLSAVEAQS